MRNLAVILLCSRSQDKFVWPGVSGGSGSQSKFHRRRFRLKRFLVLLVLGVSFSALSQNQKPKPAPTLKSILLEQLRSTHNQEEWFVPANIAVAGLTAEQANWSDGKGNHSVGQLATHLIYWDRRNLARFKGEPQEKFTNNDETFTRFDSKSWADTVKQLDEVMSEWEKAVEAADEEKLKSWYSTIAHVGAHNAYHIGQIIFVRKEQGSWDPEKGVKG
jgi:uncharacterized damage-inducible protein DinB